MGDSLNPHHATATAKMVQIALEIMTIAMAWPTESPCVKNVFGVCHVATVSDDLANDQLEYS